NVPNETAKFSGAIWYYGVGYTGLPLEPGSQWIEVRTSSEKIAITENCIPLRPVQGVSTSTEAAAGESAVDLGNRLANHLWLVDTYLQQGSRTYDSIKRADLTCLAAMGMWRTKTTMERLMGHPLDWTDESEGFSLLSTWCRCIV
ncbi:MAG: hypothetical protein ACRDGA_10680, partial [Bacteroidota bacterium]